MVSREKWRLTIDFAELGSAACCGPLDREACLPCCAPTGEAAAMAMAATSGTAGGQVARSYRAARVGRPKKLERRAACLS
jgi:hypothetical protein